MVASHRERHLASGRGIPPAPMPDPVLDGFQAALRGAGVAGSSAAGYVADVRAFLAWARDRGLSPLDVRCEHVASYRDDLLRHREPSSVRRALSALRRFFAHLQATRVRSDLPTSSVASPRSVASTPPILTAEAVHALLRQAETGGHPRDRVRNEMLVTLLLRTGIRVGELVALRWRDLDLEARVVRVSAGKGPRSRTMPLDVQVQRTLIAWRDVTLLREGELRGRMLSRNGRPLTARAVQRRLQILGALAGLPPGSVHAQALRHVFATSYLARHLGDVRGLQLLLGHASLTTTASYLLPSLGELARLAAGPGPGWSAPMTH